METGRRKSCDACVRAKRRCELGRPQCRRCLFKNIDCTYPLPAPPTVAATNTGKTRFQDAASIAFAGNSASEMRRSSEPLTAPETPPLSMNSAWFEFYNEPFNLPALPADTFFDQDFMGNAFSQQPVDCVQQMNENARIRSEFVSRRLAQIPKSFVEQAQTPFIHRGLLQTSHHQVLQDALSAAALYFFRNDNNRPFVVRTLEQKARFLIETTDLQAAHRSSLLAATQALLVYQLIRLFDGDIRLRAQAEADEAFLTSWAIQLRSSMQLVSVGGGKSGVGSPLSLDLNGDMDWQSWLLEESIRRTVIVAFMLKGIYGFLKTGIDVEQDLQLSFNAHSKLWNAQSQRGWSAIRTEQGDLEVRVTNWNEDIGKACPDDLEDLGVEIMTMLWGVDKTAQWLGKDKLLERHGFDTA